MAHYVGYVQPAAAGETHLLVAWVPLFRILSKIFMTLAKSSLVLKYWCMWVYGWESS